MYIYTLLFISFITRALKDFINVSATTFFDKNMLSASHDGVNCFHESMFCKKKSIYYFCHMIHFKMREIVDRQQHTFISFKQPQDSSLLQPNN